MISNAADNRISGLGYSYEPILVFKRPVYPLLVLFEPIQGQHASAKTKPHELMTAADCQHRNPGFANEFAKRLEHLRIVEIEIAERATDDDGVGFYIFRG